MLAEGLKKLGIEPTEMQAKQLDMYINELMIWNDKLNLVSIRSRDELIGRHVLDCLAGLEAVRELPGDTVADVGSGAGLPGLLFAIFMEDRSFSLIERSGKKAGFLRTSAALLGMADRVEVLDKDLKEVRGSFDIVTLRAFREFGDFYPLLNRITASGGTVAAFKAKRASVDADLSAAGLNAGDAEVRTLEVPFLPEERHMLLVRL